MDRFQCTWVAMIGELYELIVEYLGNEFMQEPASYIGMCCPIKSLLRAIMPFKNDRSDSRLFAIRMIVTSSEIQLLAEGCWC